jgi:hypothetical protein
MAFITRKKNIMKKLNKIVVGTLSFLLLSSFCYSSEKPQDSFSIPRYGRFNSIAIGMILFLTPVRSCIVPTYRTPSPTLHKPINEIDIHLDNQPISLQEIQPQCTQD